MSSATGTGLQTQGPRPGPADNIWLDFVDFGDEASEAAHALASEASAVVADERLGVQDLPSGADEILIGNPNEPARIALPLEPAETKLGDLRFSMVVDPRRQNYLTVKFWGEDSSPYKTLVLVNGEQAAYRTVGDYEPINVGTLGGLPGRFFHATAALPLASTSGESVVEISLRTYVLSYRTLAGQTGFEKATDVSRRFFSAGTHTVAALPPSILMAGGLLGNEDTRLEPASLPERPSAEEAAKIVDGFRRWQVKHFEALESRADAGEPLPIGRYEDDLRFYAEALLMGWSPAGTAEKKRRGLTRIFASIDHYTREYYGNVVLLGSGGHQSDWGGYYAALGEALYIIENLIADSEVLGHDGFGSFLDEPFSTGSTEGRYSLADAGWNGGPLTRREAWERVLKANFDFARSRLSYIYNQVMYTYEGAWKAHEGLRVIGSPFYQGRDRSHRIVREFLGIEPFLGEEVLRAPGGRELDVHHSLFHHDGNAEYTDDYIQVIMKGVAESKLDADGGQVRRKPYGRHYYGLTMAGLVRENGYVGVYGEATNYFPCWFFRTLGHAGDEQLNNDILKVALKNLHARSYTRYQGRTAKGQRTMFMEQVVDDRNSDYPGRPAYGTDEDSGAALRYASLEEFMARHAARYSGQHWAEYWEYAREATGYAQQQLLDGQFFGSFQRRWMDRKLKYDLRIHETYSYVTDGRAALLGSAGAGRVLPHSHLTALSAQELTELGVDEGWDNTSFAWVDIDNLLVSARDGDTHLFANLLQRNCGLSGASRAHIQYKGTEQLLQFQAEADQENGYVTIRGTTREELRQNAWDEVIQGRPFALTGELLPVSWQPGVGVIRRDNFVEDNPYSAYPEIVTAHLGGYFIAINTTRNDYGNRRTAAVALPSGDRSASVYDLVTGEWLPLTDGMLALEPLTAVVLKTGVQTSAAPEVPARVPAVIATAGAGRVGLSWKRVPGATGYTVFRAAAASDGEVVRAGIPATAAIVDAGKGEYSYTVTAVNSHGPGAPSHPVHATTMPTSAGSRFGATLIGSATDAEISPVADRCQFRDVTAGGFAGGDDANLYRRGGRDSVAAAMDLAIGPIQLTARLASASASAGVMLRENLTDHARYVYFGADDSGNLVVRTRSLDTREDFGPGNPGDDAGGGKTRSPYTWDLGLRLDARPWLRLQRDAEGHQVTALVSTDGKHWERVAQVIVPMPEVVHAGVGVTGEATFDSVGIVALEPDVPVLTAALRGSKLELAWTKPRALTFFDVYGVNASGAASLIAEGLWQTALSLPATLPHQKYKVIGRGPGGRTVSSAEIPAG